jgi:hypothetical protein
MTKQMIDGSAGPARKDIGTLLIASLFIGLGLVTLYDVTTTPTPIPWSSRPLLPMR